MEKEMTCPKCNKICEQPGHMNIISDSGLPPNGEWKVGDVVEAFGVRGHLVRATNPGEFPLLVLFGENSLNFTPDGKACEWHATPSLRFISREKKKVRKTVTAWMNVYRNGGKEVFGEKYIADEYGADDCIACVELKGEYEVEEDA